MSGTNNQLAEYVARIERLNETKAEVTEDLKELYIEVRSAGFDPKIVRQVVKRRAEDEAARREREELIRTYEEALGDFKTSPLGQAGAPGRG